MAMMLVGVKILDLSQLLPGPFCTQILADLGAEVIKIERPGSGDPGRDLKNNIGGYGSSFIMLNRNKKSMTLNLNTREGAEIFRRLAATADVVVEGFRPGVVDRLGISYQNLRRDNRKIVYCSLTGYGQDGPYAHLPGHDLNYMSYAGLASLTGARGHKPTPAGVQSADVAAGSLFAALAILAALYQRKSTGRGQYIDVAMVDGLMAIGQTLFGEHFATGKVPGPGTMRLSGGYPPYNVYETKDSKFFSMGNLERKFWDVFCQKVERDDLLEMHSSGWDVDRDKLEDELTKLFLTKTRDEWTALLAREETCCSPVLTLDEALEDAHNKARGLITEAPHPEPDHDPVPQISFPVKFTEIDTTPPGPAPRLGQHTEEILLSVGYNKKEIKEFGDNGVT